MVREAHTPNMLVLLLHPFVYFAMLVIGMVPILYSWVGFNCISLLAAYRASSDVQS